ncbi:MAG: hypothetical protein ACK6BL_02805 [Holosporaceae bacterium]
MSDIIDGLDLLINLVTGVTLGFLAYFSNKISKMQNNIAARDVYLSVYDKISEALGSVLAKGFVDESAKALFWQARDRARLELPNELKEYTQQLYDKMLEANTIYYNKITGDFKLPVGQERNKIVQEHTDIIKKLIYEKPHQIFSKYMTIKNLF